MLALQCSLATLNANQQKPQYCSTNKRNVNKLPQRLAAAKPHGKQFTSHNDPLILHTPLRLSKAGEPNETAPKNTEERKARFVNGLSGPTRVGERQRGGGRARSGASIRRQSSRKYLTAGSGAARSRVPEYCHSAASAAVGSDEGQIWSVAFDVDRRRPPGGSV